MASSKLSAAATAYANDVEARTFGADRDGVRIVLYRDQAAWCPYCQKVWILLEEKRIPYITKKVPMRSYGKKPGWFLEKVPSGLLPAVEIDGKLMTESIDIMIALNDIDPTRTPMLPLDDPGMRRAEKLLRLERKLFGAWCQMLFRPPPVLGRQNLSTSVKRLLGMDASSVDGNDDETESPPEALDFLSCLDQVDAELAADVSTPWFFSAEHPSLVDLQFITHVERMLASTLYWKGIVIRGGRWKHINRWLDAFELRPSYMNTKSDYYTHVYDIPPQYGQAYEALGQDGQPSGRVRRAQEVVDGRGGWWDIDVIVNRLDERMAFEPIAQSELDDGKESACAMAAQRLRRTEEHFDAVVRFACRGTGRSGRPGFAAELADPNAEPNETCFEPVHRLLTIVHRLLESACLARHVDAARHDAEASASVARAEADIHEVVDAFSARVPGIEMRSCLEYLVRRVGVPRDMNSLAALMFRSHVNFVIERIGT